jgi:hypothetical protein
MITAKTIYCSPLFPEDEQLTRNIHTLELVHGKLISTIFFSTLSETESMNRVVGFFRKE